MVANGSSGGGTGHTGKRKIPEGRHVTRTITLAEDWQDQEAAKPLEAYLPVPKVLRTEDGTELPRWRVRVDIDAGPLAVLGFDLYGSLILGRGASGQAESIMDLTPFGAEDRGVSRRHLELRPSPHSLLAVDLGSTNGTFLNNVRLKPGMPTPLGSRDSLMIGTLPLVVEVIDAPQHDNDWFALQATLGQALSEMATAVTSEPNMSDVMAAVLDYAIGLTKAQGGALWLYNPDQRAATAKAVRGTEAVEIDEVLRGLESSPVGAVILSGEPRWVQPDAPGNRFALTSEYLVESAILVPLSLGGKPLGVLCVSNHAPGNDFHKNHKALLAALADFAAIAIANAESLEAERKRGLELEALYRSSLAVSSSLDVQKVLDAVLDGTSELVPGVDDVHAFLAGEGGPVFHVQRVIQAHDDTDDASAGAQDVAQQVFDNGEVVVVAPAMQRMASQSQPSWQGTIAGFPLKVGSRLVGVITARSATSLHGFSDEQMSLLQLLGTQAGIAIENAGLFDDLAVAYEDLREANRIKSEMIQNVSHELRTPLTYLVGYVGMMLDETQGMGSLNSEQRESLEIVQRQADRLTELVKNFVVLQASDATGTQLQPWAIETLLEEAVESAALEARNANIDLAYAYDDHLPPVMVNQLGISRVLDNLLSNALKFTPDSGSVRLHAGLEPKTGKVRVTVADTGIGIANEDQERVFKRFYQVDGSQTRHYAGVGLGLAVCAEILHSHGERIWIEQSSRKGTTFAFTLSPASANGSTE